MNKLYVAIIIIMLIIVSHANQTVVAAELENKQPKEMTVVYFFSPTCSGCNKVKAHIEGLEAEGFTVIKNDITDPNQNNNKLLRAYNRAYFVPNSEGTVPIIFAGNKYVSGVENVIHVIETGKIHALAVEDLKDVKMIDYEINGFLGYIAIVFSGLLDGFNPCAIAMLLMFISLLGFTDRKKTLIAVSITYITALYLTYFALGTVLYRYVGKFQSQITYLSSIITWLIILLATGLFIFSLYDFIVSKNEEYAKIKLQLPKGIQKLNKRIIRYFTNAFNEKSDTSLILVLVMTFILGFIISLTEFLCTGQIYLPVIISLVHFGEGRWLAIVMLLIYNLAFVLPLIVIAIVSIKSKSVLVTSNYVREHLHIIKLLNALFFLLIAVFYIVTTFII